MRPSRVDRADASMLLQLSELLWTASNASKPKGSAGFKAPASEIEGFDCESAGDIFAFLFAHGNYLELFGYLGLMLSICVTLAGGSFFLGVKVKPRSPLYWKSRTWNPWSEDFEAEVDVTEELRQPIQGLINRTTKKEIMGQGRDGAWATHKGFKILKITRIESGPLWSDYARMRQAVWPVAVTKSRMAKEWREYTEKTIAAIDSAHQSREDPSSAAFIRSLRLDKERNERLMFHACPGMGAREKSTGEILFKDEKCSPVYAIKQAGFDDRLGNVKGMYGSGTYFADMASKADQYGGQYSEPGKGSVGEVTTMFLSRVVLGCPYNTDQSLEQLRRPPCIQGHFDLNLSWNDEVQFGKPWRDKGVPFEICNHHRFDSVMGDFKIDQKNKNYREFVVYERQCYPEFCITYERTAD